MANEEHLQIIRRGVEIWNEWRKKDRGLAPDLSEVNLSWANLSGADLSWANLSGADLSKADLSWANLSKADLSWANLSKADLSWANLTEAKLFKADLSEANLSGAKLSGANLSWARLSEANLTEAKLFKADLREANLTEANLTGAILTAATLEAALLIHANLSGASLAESRVYGASVWDIKVDYNTKQQNLIITDRDQQAITVDNIKLAQFIYLLLENREIRDVIDTITSKVVLILGRFSEERKPVLDAIRDELRNHDYLPIMFDFQASANQATIETIKTLASMARFVIADLTDARSVLQELQAIVPDFPSLAVRLMIKRSQHEYGMLDFIRRFPWVIKDPYEYENEEEVIASIENVIVPAEAKVKELRQSN